MSDETSFKTIARIWLPERLAGHVETIRQLHKEYSEYLGEPYDPEEIRRPGGGPIIDALRAVPGVIKSKQEFDGLMYWSMPAVTAPMITTTNGFHSSEKKADTKKRESAATRYARTRGVSTTNLDQAKNILRNITVETRFSELQKDFMNLTGFSSSMAQRALKAARDYLGQEMVRRGNGSPFIVPLSAVQPAAQPVVSCTPTTPQVVTLSNTLIAIKVLKIVLDQIDLPPTTKNQVALAVELLQRGGA